MPHWKLSTMTMTSTDYPKYQNNPKLSRLSTISSHWKHIKFVHNVCNIQIVQKAQNIILTHNCGAAANKYLKLYKSCQKKSATSKLSRMPKCELTQNCPKLWFHSRVCWRPVRSKAWCTWQTGWPASLIIFIDILTEWYYQLLATIFYYLYDKVDIFIGCRRSLRLWD